MLSRFKLGKNIVAVLVIFCVVIVGALGIFTFAFFDDISKLVVTISLIKMYSLTDDLSLSDILDGAVKGIIGSLDDPYSTYLEKENYEQIQERIKGTYGGIGLLISLDEDNNLVVISPFKGTPAQKEGIMAGDLITAVDGVSTSDMDLETAANKMQGEPGTEVVITIFREGRGEKEYKITREIIEIPSVEGKIIDEHPEIGYINITTFNENTRKELSETIFDLQDQGMKAVVLDLRNNPGGALSASIETADVFLDSGPIVHIDSRGESKVFEAREGKIDMPMVVLINEGSASASEILAGAIQDNNLGILVGQKTFGKGLVQSVFELRDGSAVQLTTAKYFTPDKRDIHEEGIEPDIVIEMDVEETAQAIIDAPNLESDRQLIKALEVLKEKIAN